MADNKPRVLILKGHQASKHPAAQLLSEHYTVEQFTFLDKAVQALKSGNYDAVFADAQDFLPLERAMVGQKASLVLNTIGEGVCLIDSNGTCLWSNKKMQGFSDQTNNQVRRICLQAMASFNNRPSGKSASNAAYKQPGAKRAGQQNGPKEKPLAIHPHSKKFAFQAGEQYFEMICSPVLDDHNRNTQQVVAVVWDASDVKMQQAKLNAIDSSGRELTKIGSEAVTKLPPAQRLKFLQEKIIRYSRDLMHFDHFAIRLLEKNSGKLEVVISEGLPISALDMDIYAQPQGNGISGYVASTGRSYLCHDTEKDSRYIPGLNHCKSSLTVPLMLFDDVVGIYNIESSQVGSFSEDDRQFAEIFGRHVALALNILDLLLVERFTTSGQISDSVLQEMAQPLNDMQTELQTLQDECHENIAIYENLQNINKYIGQIRTVMKNVAAGPSTVLGSDEPQEQDPLLAGKKILIADDDANIRKTIGDVLSKAGSSVRLCKDGHKACQSLSQDQFDLIISDIKMPYRNGYEIYAAAQRVREGMPVILMTGFGYDPSHSIVRASQEGLACVLFKPFKIDQLIEEIHKALGK